MTGNEPGELEHKVAEVADSYIISVRRKEESAGVAVSAEESQQKLYETLQQRIQQLQQEYGAEKLSVVRAFELIPAIAAVIKENAVIEALRQEGYLVEQQGIMRTQNFQSYEAKAPQQDLKPDA